MFTFQNRILWIFAIVKVPFPFFCYGFGKDFHLTFYAGIPLPYMNVLSRLDMYKYEIDIFRLNNLDLDIMSSG